MNNKTIRSLGVGLLCSHLLKDVCENIKQDSEIYHHKTKNQLNNLLSTVDGVLSKAYNVNTIKKASEYLRKELEQDVVQDEIITNAEIISLVTDILLTLNPQKIYDTHMLLSNIKQGKRLYTQEEYEKINSISTNTSDILDR